MKDAISSAAERTSLRRNQTKVGLKVPSLLSLTVSPTMKKSDQGGIESYRRGSIEYSSLMRRNQTKVGLKVEIVNEASKKEQRRNQTKVGLKGLA